MTEKILRVAEAERALGRETSVAPFCQRVVDLVASTFRVDICGLFLKEEPDRLAIAARYEYPLDGAYKTLKLGLGLVGWVAEHKTSALVPDVRIDRRYLGGIAGVESELTVPLLVGGEVLGVIDVESRKPAAFSESDRALLEAFAGCAAALLHMLLHRDDGRAKIIELKSRSDRLELIHRVGRTFVEGPTLKDAMQRVVDMVATQLHYSQTAVLILDEKLEELEVVSAFGYGDVAGLRIPVTQGATGYAVRHGEPVKIADVTSDPRYVKGIRGGRSELVVPIMRRDKICGVLDVESPVLDAFDDEDLHLLSVVASYTGSAIRAAEVEEELHRTRSQLVETRRLLTLLGDVSRKLRALAAPDDILREVLRLAVETLGIDGVAVWIVDPVSGELVARHIRGIPEIELGARVRLADGLIGHVLGTRRALAATADDQRWQSASRAPGRAEVAAPLELGGEVMGVIQVAGGAQPFSEADQDLVAAFAEQVSLAMTSAGLRASTERQVRTLDDRTRRLDLLNGVARSLTQRLDIEQLLEELLRLCAEAFDLTHCAVLLLDGNGEALLRKASLGYAEDAPTELAVGEGITGHVASTGVPVLVADVTKDPRYITGVSGGRSEMAAPLRVFGEVIGVLDAESAEEAAFDEDDLDLFTSFAAQAAVAIHNADLATTLKRMGGG